MKEQEKEMKSREVAQGWLPRSPTPKLFHSSSNIREISKNVQDKFNYIHAGILPSSATILAPPDMVDN